MRFICSLTKCKHTWWWLNENSLAFAFPLICPFTLQWLESKSLQGGTLSATLTHKRLHGRTLLLSIVVLFALAGMITVTSLSCSRLHSLFETEAQASLSASSHWHTQTNSTLGQSDFRMHSSHVHACVFVLFCLFLMVLSSSPSDNTDDALIINLSTRNYIFMKIVYQIF